MEPSKDTISVRVSRLNSQLLNKSQNSADRERLSLITRESLLDALQLLYDECNTDCLKSCDKNIATFASKYRKVMSEVKQLRVNVSDFEVRTVVGRGQFGEVHMVKEKRTGDVYAMKTVRKYENMEHKCTSFEEERNIMAVANSPWITKLHYAFQDQNNLYFIMEYHPGGDLLELMHRQGGTLTETAAVFYLAELVLGINALHQMGFLHRDIKPDNILFDRCGHVKLVDFGSAVKLNKNGFVVSGGVPVGTPDYIAPEVLQSADNKQSKPGESYGKPCDYWSLGILAYELVIGTTPFSSHNVSNTYSRIMNFSKSLKFPAEIAISQAYVSLVKALLIDHYSRLDYDKIIKHALFKNTDFDGLRDQVPPFVPKIVSLDDTSNFSGVQAKKKTPHIDNFKTKTQFSGRNLPFVGFTFTTEPTEYKDCYKVTKAKDEAVDQLKSEIETLKIQHFRSESVSNERDALQKKLEKSSIKLESLASLQQQLEKELADKIAECGGLKRTLELERKDRSELERKALELIKITKTKWEAAEKLKVDQLNTELQRKEEKICELAEEVAKLKDDLELSIYTSEKHKASIEKVENLGRSSVIGLEARLEVITNDTQNQISSLKSELFEENQKRNDLQSIVKELERNNQNLQKSLEESVLNCQTLKQRCEASEKLAIELNDDAEDLKICFKEIDKYKQIIHDLETEIAEAVRNLEQENQSSLVLKKQIKDLKGELNSMRAQKLSSLDEMKDKHEATIKDLEQQLKAITADKHEIELKYREADLSLKSKEDKVTMLEELLNRLESDLYKLENGSERETVLKEQIQRLEQQLVEVHEQSALEKHEMSQLKTKYWRMEKDLSNAKLDRKIVERDLVEYQGKTKELENEIDKLNERLITGKESNQAAVSELNELNQKLCNDVLNLKQEIKALDAKLASQRAKDADGRMECDRLKRDVEAREAKICAVLDSLDTARKENVVLQKSLEDMKQQGTKDSALLKEYRRNACEANENLEKSRRELDNNLLNYKALREACTILESQLVEFEKILDESDSKNEKLEADLKRVQSETTKIKTELQSARKLANEEKSLKLLAETKVKRLQEELENMQKEIRCFTTECSEIKDFSKSLTEELNKAEQQEAEYRMTIQILERQKNDYCAENRLLKEENSKQLTFIENLKESNYKLGNNLTEAKQVIEEFMDKVQEMDVHLNQTKQFYVEREVKVEAQMQQQTKLIDFLQVKVEEQSKKKKTLSDKLFGNSKKENVPPISLVLNYKDLETQLNKLKEQNNSLSQEVFRLKAGNFKNSENHLKSEARNCLKMQGEMLAQIVQSPTSQKNDLYRQNSVQRMHHNIPHRFETKICTKQVKCAQCDNNIMLGRNYSACRECHLPTHASCSASLPRTCGLPTAYAKHYADSLSKLQTKSPGSSKAQPERVDIEGWVKIPKNNTGWERAYACLTATTLIVYPEPPTSNSNVEPLQTISLNPVNGHSKLILEPLASEISVPVANNDLPFIVKIESAVNSTCWPSQCLVFMTLSTEDKEKWFKGLQGIFNINEKYTGEIVLNDTEELQINCVLDLYNGTNVFGADSGLYSAKNNKLIHIAGLQCVHEILSIPQINTVLMIAQKSRQLVSCDLKQLMSLSECAPCSKPTLQFKVVSTNKVEGFHIIEAANFAKNENVCIANPKQVAILKYDYNHKEFFPQRFLDTAEPVGCILFTEHSVIVGANKFFEVDLSTFEADEFLDVTDENLAPAIRCYKSNSFPLAIVQVSKSPAIEYLVCFNEFATFVDAYGRSTRSNDFKWTRLPTAFYYAHNYLYIVQFNGVEVYKITGNTCETVDPSLVLKLQIDCARYLGHNDSGIFVHSAKEIKYINARVVDDDASTTVTEMTQDEGNNSDRYSFSSSIVQSLDGNLSDDAETVQRDGGKHVKFTNL